MTVDKLETRIKDQRFSPYVPVPIATDVPEDIKIWIDEHQAELPVGRGEPGGGAPVPVRPARRARRRVHGQGDQGGAPQPVAQEVNKAKPYTLNDEIGKYGVEKTYEADLRGTPGVRRIEVDSKGNPVRTLSETPPIPGDDVVLNLNIDVQAVAEQALQSGLDHAAHTRTVGSDIPNKGQVGSSVVIDPRNGGVLAMASYPTFNPRGLRRRDQRDRVGLPPGAREPLPAEQLGAPGPVRPRVHVQALHRGVRPGRGAHHAVPDGVRHRHVHRPRLQGRLVQVQERRRQVLRRRRPAQGPHGVVRLLLLRPGGPVLDRPGQRRRPRGAGRPPQEVGLPQRHGHRPPRRAARPRPSPAWLVQYCKGLKTPCTREQASWRTGKNVNEAIGQGEVLVTPLQLASAYATLPTAARTGHRRS